MKALTILEIALAIVLWALVAIVIWALWPWFLKMLVVAQQIHNLGLR